MKVLMFCLQFAPIIGGAERQAEKLGVEMAARGLDVDLWTPQIVPGTPANQAIGGMQVIRFPLQDLSKAFPRIRGIGAINGPWIAMQIMYRIWRAVGAADVVHCHIGSLQTVAAACAARLRGVPVICKAAIADKQSDLGEAAKGSVIGRIVAWIGRHIFVKWVATTSAVQEALVRAGVPASRIVVIPNGVAVPDQVAIKADPARPVRRFLYLGRLSTNIERDVPGLLRAFDAVATEVAGIELAVVGGGDLLEQTRELAGACRHSAQIHVIGFGNASEWLSWADCLVLPSRREGLSNALLEAMAAGLPCIAYDIPPNREVLAGGQAGWLVPCDAASLEVAMKTLARDVGTAATYATAAYQRTKNEYSLEAVAEKYIGLYQHLKDRTKVS